MYNKHRYPLRLSSAAGKKCLCAEHGENKDCLKMNANEQSMSKTTRQNDWLTGFLFSGLNGRLYYIILGHHLVLELRHTALLGSPEG